MANKPIIMHLIRRLIQLSERGYSERSIAKELSLSRPTVHNYRLKLHSCGHDYAALQSLDDAALAALVYQAPAVAKADSRREYLDKRMDYLVSELRRKHVTRRLLWEEYIREKPDGYGFTQFCLLIARRLSVTEPVMVQQYLPAEKVLVDFAGDKIGFTDRETGLVSECPVLICTLPCSGFHYAEVLRNAGTEQLLSALNNMLHTLGGVPAALKTDNMRQAVVRASRYEPVFTQAVEQWALHNDIIIETARVRKPRDKAPVERQVNISYQRIYAPLRDKVFFSLAELNAAVKEKTAELNDRIMQGRKTSRKELFEREEKGLLKPLPEDDYVLRHQAKAKVQRNYHVTLGEDWVHYSVPFRYIGKEVYLSYDSDRVEVFLQSSMERIAFHRRSYKRHAHITEADHMPDNHKAYHEQKGYTPNYFLSKAAQVGTDTRAYVAGVLEGKRFTQQTFNACLGILRLAARYGNDRLEAACKRAAGGPRFNYSTIAAILENNRDKEPLQTELFRLPDHGNIRGADAYR